MENVFIAFTADHGENLGEAGLFFEHGDNVHDAAIRVPLVLRGPGVARSRVSGVGASLSPPVIGECEEDIGEVVAFLCSDAANYISGQSIAVDGGQAYMP